MSSAASACACLGPQNGEPLCPCRMRAARDHFRIPEPARTYWPSAPLGGPTCWNEIACTMHQCRELGCAAMRSRPSSSSN